MGFFGREIVGAGGGGGRYCRERVGTIVWISGAKSCELELGAKVESRVVGTSFSGNKCWGERVGAGAKNYGAEMEDDAS